MAISRRDSLAALGATTLLPSCASESVRSGGPSTVPIIDAHAHWYPREFVTLLEREGEANGAKMASRWARETLPRGSWTTMLGFQLVRGMACEIQLVQH